MQTKEDILNLLRENVCHALFEKADGSERSMLCTLIPSFIEKPSYTENAAGSGNPELITAWDIESNGWRSFKTDRLLEQVVAIKGR